MRSRVLPVCLGLAALGVLIAGGALAACGGDVSGPTNPLNTNEPASSSVESPSSGQDSPGSSTEAPTPSGDMTGGGDEGAFPSCMGPTATETACETCVLANCPSGVRAVESACSTFLTCFKACACSDGACIEECGTNGVAAGCEAALKAADSCVTNDCASSCNGNSSSFGFGGDAGTSGQGSGGNTPVITGGGCSALSSCCSSLPKLEQSGCNSVVSLGSATTCNSSLAAYQSANLCK
jgi:hypothetical protein